MGARVVGGHVTKLVTIEKLGPPYANITFLDTSGYGASEGMERGDNTDETIAREHQRRSTPITSHLPVANWHQAMGDPTMTDAILDRVVHNACKMELQRIQYENYSRILT